MSLELVERGRSSPVASLRLTKNLMTKFWREKNSYLERVAPKTLIQIQAEIFSRHLNNRITPEISKIRHTLNHKRHMSKQFSKAYLHSGSKIQITLIRT